MKMRASAVAAFALACFATANAWALPSFEQVKAAYRSSDTVVLDRNGVPIQTVRSDPKQRRAEWVGVTEVSPAFRQALLLSEDKRFYEHSGVDWSGVGAAAWGSLWNSRTRGASTVTMQLAGLLDTDLATQKGGRSMSAKAGQVRTAWQLEHAWTKNQILEAYINLVGFRGELVGISAMSATLFKKYPSGLNAEESALAAALIRAPNAKPAEVAKRACAVLTVRCSLALEAHCGVAPPRHSDGYDSSARLALRSDSGAINRHLRLDATLDREAQIAPHIGRRLVAAAAASGASAPAILRTTLDAGLQRFARDTLRRHLAEVRERHVEDGAVIVIDNASGDVLAWVGSSGGLSQAADVDGVIAPRQAGSTLKPFLYEIALEQRWLTAASVIDDSPVGLTTSAGLYIPQNYDHHFKGPVTLRTALGSSLNVPAVRTLVMVTPERFAQRLRALGLKLQHNGDFYGYSLALGSPEVTLLSLTNAYRALANGGASSPWRTLAGERVAAPVPVMDPAASFIVSDILSDREARVPTFGLDNALAARYWAAVKTGTSKDMRDNWCVGFSRRYSVGVWVGNANGDPMWDVSGVTGAAPVWRAVMDELHRRESALTAQWRAPTAPSGVALHAVRFESLGEPPRDEFFLSGTEQSVVTPATASGSARTLITSPADRSIVALDPDIPQQSQRLRIAAVSGTPASWSWRMDGKRIGSASATVHWPLWPGPHRLELVDAMGKVAESATFEVRGAEVKNAPAKPARPIKRGLRSSGAS
ncbi:MAG: penicillin-binding protein 1C [Burkholderiales bacterium]|nr:penicillin-binding protein 1C [Burkholderiales bacterium]